jgi:hypothetical protein
MKTDAESQESLQELIEEILKKNHVPDCLKEHLISLSKDPDADARELLCWACLRITQVCRKKEGYYRDEYLNYRAFCNSQRSTNS